MLDEGEKLVPGLRSARALRVWAGVRPLFEDKKTRRPDSTRDVSRSHVVLDHLRRDGVRGLPLDHRRQAHDLPADGAGHRRRDGAPARGRPSVHDRGHAAAGLRGGATTGSARGCARASRSCSTSRSSASASSSARRGSRMPSPARHGQPRRPPAQPAARHGAVPGRLLHLSRDGHPARRRQDRRPAGDRLAASTSCRSAGRASSRSSTATSPGRHSWTTGSSRACSTSSTCRPTSRAFPLPSTPSSSRRRSHEARRHRGRHRRGRPRGGLRLARARRARARPRQRHGRHASRRRDDRRSRLCARASRVARGALPRLSPPDRTIRTPASASEAVAEALGWLRDQVAAGPLRRTATRAASRTTCSCPPRSACRSRRRSRPRPWLAGDLRSDGARSAFVGLRGLKDFHPHIFAENLARHCRRPHRGAGDGARLPVTAGWTRAGRASRAGSRRPFPGALVQRARRPLQAGRARRVSRRPRRPGPARCLARARAPARAGPSSKSRPSRRRCPACASTRSCARRSGRRGADHVLGPEVVGAERRARASRPCSSRTAGARRSAGPRSCPLRPAASPRAESSSTPPGGARADPRACPGRRLPSRAPALRPAATSTTTRSRAPASRSTSDFDRSTPGRRPSREPPRRRRPRSRARCPGGSSPATGSRRDGRRAAGIVVGATRTATVEAT